MVLPMPIAEVPPAVKAAHLLVTQARSVGWPGHILPMQSSNGQHIASFTQVLAAAVPFVHTQDAHAIETPLAAVIVVHSIAVSAVLLPPPPPLPPPLPLLPPVPPLPAVLVPPVPAPESVPLSAAPPFLLLQPILKLLSASTSRPHPRIDKGRFISILPRKKSPAVRRLPAQAGES
jgi:hypothetical protein